MILYTGIRAISGLQFKGYPGKNRNHGVSEITIVVARVGTKSRYLRYKSSLIRKSQRPSGLKPRAIGCNS